MKIVSREEITRRLRAVVSSYRTQKEAAKELGVSDSYLSQVMNGGKPPSAALLALAGTQKISLFVEVDK
jgi:transcriptional regulator with XRE-family HTH domain